MKVIKTKFKGLLIIKKPSYPDTRGYFRELFLQKLIKKKFVFDYVSKSKKNVLRGLHLQKKNNKVNLLLYLMVEYLMWL